MTPREFIESGKRAQERHERRVQQIELEHERAIERAEDAFRRRCDALRAKREAALNEARLALEEQETADWRALHDAGHAYEEVKILRGDAARINLAPVWS